MWINKRENILKLIIILTIVNLAALGTMFYQMNMRRGPEPPDTRAREIYKKELQLNEKQQLGFDELHKQFRIQSQGVVEQIRDKKREMLDELEKQDPDTVKLNQIAIDLGELHGKLKRSTYQHFIEMKKICGPEQQDKLHHMYRNMIERPKDDFERRGRGRHKHRRGRNHTDRN